MSNLAQQGLAGGGEGIDSDFRPNVELADGEKIASDCWELEVIHTPGHLGNHIALAWRGICFTGDHVMGWASTLVSPPDGLHGRLSVPACARLFGLPSRPRGTHCQSCRSSELADFLPDGERGADSRCSCARPCNRST